LHDQARFSDGRFDASEMHLDARWPDLHTNYQQVLEKRRATDLTEQAN